MKDRFFAGILTAERSERRQIFNRDQEIYEENRGTILILSMSCAWSACGTHMIQRSSTVLFVRYSANYGRKRLSSCDHERVDEEKNFERYDKVWIFRTDRNGDRGCWLLGSEDTGSNKIIFYLINFQGIKKIEQKREKIKFTCKKCRCKFTSDEYSFEHKQWNKMFPATNYYTDTCPSCWNETTERQIGF